jgi:CRISPR-associated protein Cmr3
VLVYLATPGLWPGGWRIPVPPGARLVAAATGEPEPVATLTPGGDWRQSRVLRWAAPAGSVYLLQFDDAEHGAAWARDVHGTAYGRGLKDRLRTAGFGVVLTGAWT